MVTQYLSKDMLDAIVLVLTISVFSLVLTAFFLGRSVKGFRKRWSRLFDGTSIPNLEKIYCENMEQIDRLKQELERTNNQLKEQRERLTKAVQHIGCVRFDAFEDVGGKQSFAIALYDDNGNGVVLTSMVGRQECRVYGKPIIKGKTERQLLDEESQAIHVARDREKSLNQEVLS